jgi:hypothetical protein
VREIIVEDVVFIVCVVRCTICCASATVVRIRLNSRSKAGNEANAHVSTTLKGGSSNSSSEGRC